MSLLDFWKIPHSIMFNKLMKKNADGNELLVNKDKMGTYEYTIRWKMEYANVMSYYKLYNAIPNRFYGSIW